MPDEPQVLGGMVGDGVRPVGGAVFRPMPGADMTASKGGLGGTGHERMVIQLLANSQRTLYCKVTGLGGFAPESSILFSDAIGD